MIKQATPIFQEAHILRKTMMEALSDYVFLTDRFFYKGYGDGILAGCELTTTRDTIVLNEGVILYDGQLFLIKEPMSVTYYPTNTTTVLKLCFSDAFRDENFIYQEMDLLLTEQTGMKRGELELCRFKLQEGAYLRYQYQNFEDRSTEFDTLNTIHAVYSAKGESTLSLEIVQEFASEMLKADSLSDLDAMFCLQLLGASKPVNKAMLVSYIECRDKKQLKERSNDVIYQELVRILKEAVQGRKFETGMQGKKRWRMNIE
jgi:hypothetical protein